MTTPVPDDVVERALFAVVTAAIHDMNGFVSLGEIGVADYESAAQHEWPDDAPVTYILDLWDRTGHFADKYISRETAAALLGADAASLDQSARQMLAQINDEDMAYSAARSSRGR